MRLGWSSANARKASRSSSNAVMKEWAIVPETGDRNSRAASTLDVARKPTSALPRAAARAASTPWARRNAKSTSSRPSAAMM